jgi:hypothetical protein
LGSDRLQAIPALKLRAKSAGADIAAALEAHYLTSIVLPKFDPESISAQISLTVVENGEPDFSKRRTV